MTRTDGIPMTAVDAGWITDVRPHPTKLRLAEEGFHGPDRSENAGHAP